VSNYEPYRFLREMKEQEELNEKALNFLRGRVIYPERYLFIYQIIKS
jgi:predicted ribonuclease YlaK